MIAPKDAANRFLVQLVTDTDREKIVYFDPDGMELSLDLRSIMGTLNRLHEVAIVNAGTAPELMSALNKTWLDLGELVVVIRHRLMEAKNRLKEERSRILIDEVPRLLQEKKLTNSKDNRDALIDLNESYQSHQETVHQIEAILQWAIDKRDGVRNAWSSVRAILGDKSGIPLSGKSPYMSGGQNGATRVAPNSDDPWGISNLD